MTPNRSGAKKTGGADPALRPRLLVLADQPRSSFAHVAGYLAAAAAKFYDVEMVYTNLGSAPDFDGYDMILACCWWDDGYWRSRLDPRRVAVQVFSLENAQDGSFASPESLAAGPLSGVGMVLASGADLYARLRRHVRARRIDLGVDPAFFHPAGRGHNAEPRIGIVSGALCWVRSTASCTHNASRAASGRVRFGFLARDAAPAERRDFFRAHDIVVVLDHDFWSRLCLVEAMACGAFVIAGPHGSDLLVNGVSGLVVANDSAEGEAAIRWVLRDVSAIAEGGAIAAHEAMIGHNWNLLGDHYVAMLWGHLCRIRDAEKKAA